LLVFGALTVSPAAAFTAPPGYRNCGSFQARYTIHVFAKHVSCRKARRLQKEYWLAPESEKELVGPDEYNGYVRLKRFPGWRCTSGAMAGGCRKGRKEAGYSTYNGRPAWRGRLPRRSGGRGRALPEVPTITFGGPREWQVKPKRIDMGDSACAPIFSKLRWVSYGPGRARARGQGVFPHLDAASEDCETALERARLKATRLILSRPRFCYGHLMFTRIGWRAPGEHAHFTTTCG
jgi:hypothetical protein